jgi:hypothetical protein
VAEFANSPIELWSPAALVFAMCSLALP